MCIRSEDDSLILSAIGARLGLASYLGCSVTFLFFACRSFSFCFSPFFLRLRLSRLLCNHLPVINETFISCQLLLHIFMLIRLHFIYFLLLQLLGS